MRLFGRDDGQGTVQEIMNGFLNRTDGVAKWQRVFTAEKQAFIDFATEGGRELDVDAELSGFCQTVARPQLVRQFKPCVQRRGSALALACSLDSRLM